VGARLSHEQANDVTLYAISLVGTPYRFGGNTPESGFDCSGLIGHVYQSRAAVTSPRTVAQLKDWGQAVGPESIRSGDLVVFFQRGVATHAGIYVGQGRFVHAPSSGGVVRLDSLGVQVLVGAAKGLSASLISDWLAMTAVTQRLFGAGLATTEIDLLVFSGTELHGCKAASPMRTITKWL
jgi:hypothetical protein